MDRKLMHPPTLDSLAAKGRKPVLMDEALERLGICRATMTKWMAEGKVIRSFRPAGGSHRWPRAEFLAWLDAGCPTAAEWQAMKRGERRGKLTEAYV